MLRESCAQSGRTIDLTSVADGHPLNLEAGDELAGLVEALTLETSRSPVEARDALVVVAGEAAAERAIAVCATFQMMNRLLDGTGTPMPPGLEGIASTLGFDPTELYPQARAGS